MKYLKQNEAEFKLCNIDIWQNDNLGEGVTVVVLDSGDEVFDNVKHYNIVIPFEDEDDDTAHGTSVVAVGMQIAPKTKVVYMSYLYNDKKEKIIDWIIEHKDEIDLINCSFSGSVRELKRLEGLGLPIVCSSGNDGDKDKNGVNAPGKYDWTIAVGAYSENNGSVDHYSNGGENLDCVAPSWIYYPNSKGKPVFFNGTSCSAPFVTFSLALYFSWRKRNNLPKMNVEEVRQFIKNNTLDLYEEGHDYESGYGLFRLPKGMPDIKEVINLKDINGHWAEESIKNMIMEGIIEGYEDGTFRPDETVTRAEIAVIAERILKKVKQ